MRKDELRCIFFWPLVAGCRLLQPGQKPPIVAGLVLSTRIIESLSQKEIFINRATGSTEKRNTDSS